MKRSDDLIFFVSILLQDAISIYSIAASECIEFRKSHSFFNVIILPITFTYYWLHMKQITFHHRFDSIKQQWFLDLRISWLNLQFGSCYVNSWFDKKKNRKVFLCRIVTRKDFLSWGLCDKTLKRTQSPCFVWTNGLFLSISKMV